MGGKKKYIEMFVIIYLAIYELHMKTLLQDQQHFYIKYSQFRHSEANPNCNSKVPIRRFLGIIMAGLWILVFLFPTTDITEWGPKWIYSK